MNKVAPQTERKIPDLIRNIADSEAVQPRRWLRVFSIRSVSPLDIIPRNDSCQVYADDRCALNRAFQRFRLRLSFHFHMAEVNSPVLEVHHACGAARAFDPRRGAARARARRTGVTWVLFSEKSCNSHEHRRKV